MGEPKNKAVYRKLHDDILSGKYAVGHRFPREIEWAAELGVAKVTLRYALGKLAEEGLIARLPRLGTFVRKQGNEFRKILAVVPDLSEISSPHHYILSGVEKTALERGVKVSIVPKNFFLNAGFPPENIASNGFEGIILSGTEVSDEFERKIRKAGLPCVIAHSPSDRYGFKGFAAVRSFESCWYDALAYLLGLGHRRIAALVIDPDPGFVRYHPVDEYLAFLKKNGGSDSRSLIRHTDYFDEKNLLAALTELLKEKPTALICHSDFVAIKVMPMLKKNFGLRISDDLAVMGFCGFPGSALLTPPLSTVDYNYSLKGSAAVELLLKSSEWYSPDREGPYIRIMHTLIPRESTGGIIISH